MVDGPDNGTDPTDDPTETILAPSPKITLTKTAVYNDVNTNGIVNAGDTITYTFTVVNTGNVTVSNLVINDATIGVSNLAVTPSTLIVGATGTATATYTITQADINAGKVTNTATATGNIPGGGSVSDVSDNGNELVDDNGDNDSGNDPTITLLDGCKIEIYNSVTPNEDGLNDFFFIKGIECYANNTVNIYNRWGVIVYESKGYNNNDVSFKGFSEGRSTINRNEKLPTGTYFYILEYIDNTGKAINKSGYLYITN